MLSSVIAISTGTGGAIFLTPVLVGFMNWDIKAVGTTLFFIIFGSISGFISLSANGLVDYDAGVAVSWLFNRCLFWGKAVSLCE